MSYWRERFLKSAKLPIVGATEADLRSIKAPVCLIAGNDVIHTPVTARKAASLIPNSELHEGVVRKAVGQRFAQGMGSQGMARCRTAHCRHLRRILQTRQTTTANLFIGKKAMSLQVRRVVTGHNANGRAKVEIDEIAKNVISNRPGASSCVVWSTKGFPIDNDGFHDPTSGSFKTTVENGSVFRVVRYQPGATPRNHRTDSLDYAVVISGAIDMELDDGVTGEAQGWRRAGAARHDPQLGQPWNRRLRHRLRADQRQARVRSRQAATGRRMDAR